MSKQIFISEASRDLARGVYYDDYIIQGMLSHGCYNDTQEHGSTLIDHPIKDAPEVHVRTGLERFLNSKLGKKYMGERR